MYVNETRGVVTDRELEILRAEAKKCLTCGMLATIDPVMHESRYGHAPVIADGSGSLIWSSDGFTWIDNNPMIGHVASDENPGGPYEICDRCGLPVHDYGDGLVTVLGENPECYGGK